MIDPIFAIWPYFPLENLNNILKLRLVPNASAFTNLGNTYGLFNLNL